MYIIKKENKMINNKFEAAVIVLLIMVVILQFFIMVDGQITSIKTNAIIKFLEEVVIVNPE